MSDSGKKENEEKDDGRVHRRGFFVEGFRNLLKPIANMAEKRLDKVGLPDWDEYQRTKKQDTAESSGPIPRSPLPDRPVLRPPGALDEESFLDTCLTSGQCISSCPVSAIKWAIDEDSRREGKPFIDPQEQACVVCEDLSCMQACPSGALVPVEKESIRMGLAVLDESVCVRSEGEDCQICVDKCPLGIDAISVAFYGSPIEVHEAGCVGCGVCEMYCPTEPRSIIVKSFDVLDAEEDQRPDDDVDGSYLPMD
jgi:MauM/NapG family ferredoxin protein